MTRRLLNLLTAVSLLACMLASGLWSYEQWETWRTILPFLRAGFEMHAHDTQHAGIPLPAVVAASAALPAVRGLLALRNAARRRRGRRGFAVTSAVNAAPVE